MACCNPWFRKYDYSYGYQGFYQIPCGYCLNCRKDKQQYYIDRAEYEYKKRLTASFVTFTYDDIHNMKNAVLNPLGGFEYDVSKEGTLTPRFSLNYDDLTNFIQALRKRVNYFYDTHPEVKESVLMQRDFSYIYVGEYGDVFNRNHFHVLFFGLDFAYCKQMFFETWQYGFIDCLPVLDGAIHYVVKYMDKQTFGLLAFQQFDLKGLARPKIRMSQGFGKGLLLDNSKEIKENGMCYKAGHGVLRPISAYWKKLLIHNVSELDTSKYLENIISKNLRFKNEMREYNLKDFSTQSQIEFKRSKLLNREYNLEILVRNAGFPVQSVLSTFTNKFNSRSYDRDKILSLPTQIQRLLADEYRSSLYEDEIPF